VDECCVARGGAFSMMRNVSGAHSVGRRPSSPRGGPHGGGNGVLKVDGVAHPWGHSVRQTRWCWALSSSLGGSLAPASKHVTSSTALAGGVNGVVGKRASWWMPALLGRTSSVSS
jgi:hypothetical protein